MSVHPHAIVDPKASLGKDVEIGPFSVIGPDVEIGDGTRIMSNVVVKGPTTIGKNNTIYQFSSVGEDCQDKKYAGEPTRLEIGDDNIIRESCTLHRGTVQDESLTKIGNRNLLMAYVHVAHDCVVGDDCILANGATLAGHVHVDDSVILGGGTMVHQFSKIGTQSMSAGGSIVLRDIPAFVMASGQSASAHGLNTEGLKRKGVESETILELKRAYKPVYRKGLRLAEALEQLEDAAKSNAYVRTFVDSITRSNRGIIR
jgi:UDP-N-acetylglucosamine acyltransferase